MHKKFEKEEYPDPRYYDDEDAYDEGLEYDDDYDPQILEFLKKGFHIIRRIDG